jgi:hypothetical protein
MARTVVRVRAPSGMLCLAVAIADCPGHRHDRRRRCSVNDLRAVAVHEFLEFGVQEMPARAMARRTARAHNARRPPRPPSANRATRRSRRAFADARPASARRAPEGQPRPEAVSGRRALRRCTLVTRSMAYIVLMGHRHAEAPRRRGPLRPLARVLLAVTCRRREWRTSPRPDDRP